MNLADEIGSEVRPRRRGGGVRVVVPLVLVLVAAAAGVLAWQTWFAAGETKDLGDVVEVMRGQLTIDISQSGQIQNRDLVKVRSEVEGRTTIIKLVDEGTDVKKGELLVQLDSSGLKDQKEQQLLTVDRAEASWINAREALAVTESQAESNVEVAGLAHEFAELDLKKYLEGDYPQELLKAENDIILARQKKLQADEKFKFSKQLREKDFISKEEFERDRISQTEADLNLKLAEEKLKTLKVYTRQRKERELRSDVKQTEAAFKRAERKANADIVQAKADLKSRESELKRQKERLAKLDEQIKNCEISAPVDGMVVYATTGRQSRRSSAEPLAEGVEVRERQELIHLPVSTKMMAGIKIPESSLKKVKVGQKVRLTVDAQKGKTYWGRIGKIALLPDAQSWWLNPDLKVYNTEIYLEGDAGDLRAGMSCKAEIIVAQYDDAVYVPIQSVVRIAGEPVAFVMTPRGPERRKVKIGMDNGRTVHILSGLEGGEKVLLTPPLGESVAPITGGAPPELSDDEKGDAKKGVEDGGASSPVFDLQKWQNMSREEKRKLYSTLTPEQREALRKLRGPGGGRRPRTPGGGGRQRNTEK